MQTIHCFEHKAFVTLDNEQHKRTSSQLTSTTAFQKNEKTSRTDNCFRVEEIRTSASSIKVRQDIRGICFNKICWNCARLLTEKSLVTLCRCDEIRKSQKIKARDIIQYHFNRIMFRLTAPQWFAMSFWVLLAAFSARCRLKTSSLWRWSVGRTYHEYKFRVKWIPWSSIDLHTFYTDTWFKVWGGWNCIAN